MTIHRRYLSRLDEGGRLVIIRSDAKPMEPKEKTWLDYVITKALRNSAMLASKGVPPDEDHLQPGNLHPSIERLKALISEGGYQLGLLSTSLGRRPKALSEWLRGVSKPCHTDVYALFGVLGYRQVGVPLEVLGEVQAILDAHEERKREMLYQESMGSEEE